jgi:hypothetical protein
VVAPHRGLGKRNKEVSMKRNRYQKRGAELRKVRAILSDIDNVSEKELRSIDVWRPG